MPATPTRHPLAWPFGWKRTRADEREFGRFAKRARAPVSGSYRPLEQLTMAGACQRLLDELERFGVPEHDIVISTNVRTRLDGMPRSGEPEPKDPGAAVYWQDMGQDRCMAIDRYSTVVQNVAALAATIEAMRAIERHGGALIMNRAFTGFTALPAPAAAGLQRDWWDVLQCRADASREVIDKQWRRLAAEQHPDRGGDGHKMAAINVARDEALRALAR